MKWISLAMALLGARAMAEPADVYKGLMSDTDLYVGEGLVSPADYGGDMDKARASGRERARGGLAEGIRVKIQSSTTDTMSEKGQSFEAKSSSSAELELENLQYKYLEEFPKPGQLTVLAWLTKEEYRRQMALRGVKVGFRENGLRLASTRGVLFWPGNDTVINHEGGTIEGLLECTWRNWALGAQMWQQWVNRKSTSPNPPGPGQNPNMAQRLDNFYLWAGYDVAPWKWKLQPYLPLRVGVDIFSVGPYNGVTYGVAAGLGLRYWVGDLLALDLTGWGIQGLNKIQLSTPQDGVFGSVTSGAFKPYEIDMSGVCVQLGLKYAAF